MITSVNLRRRVPARVDPQRPAHRAVAQHEYDRVGNLRRATQSSQLGVRQDLVFDELLAERPVRQGQTLTALVDPDGEWEVEIRVPEDRFGYVVEAQHALSSESAASPPPQLEIIFVLASDPGREYRGRIVETHLAAEQRGEEGNVILVRAAIDKRQLAQLHPGTEARVRVECGSRSLGYVLLHDVWNFVQTRILFKL